MKNLCVVSFVEVDFLEFSCHRIMFTLLELAVSWCWLYIVANVLLLFTADIPYSLYYC